MLAKPATVHSAMKHQVTYGSDVGSTNWGFAGVRSRGLLRPVDQDGAVMYEGALPDITVLRIERWDLKQGRVLTHDANWNPVLLQLEGVAEGKSELMADWRRALRRCLSRLPELFEADAETGTLPVFVTENQCDMAKTDYHKTEMLRLAEQFQAQVDSLDFEKELQGRINRYANCKYMMRNDHSLGERPDRKIESVRIGLQLLADLGLEGPLRFLQGLQARGEKIDDMIDALLLAIQDQLDCAKADARAQVRELQSLIKSIPCKRTVKRGKKNLLKPVPQAKFAEGTVELDLIEDSDSEGEKRPPKRAPKTPKKAAPPKEKKEKKVKQPKQPKEKKAAKAKAPPKEKAPTEKRKRAPKKPVVLIDDEDSEATTDEKPLKKRAKTDAESNEPILLAETFFATAEENCQ